MTVKCQSFEIFVKLNGKDILLAFCAKFKKPKTCDLTEMYNFGYIVLMILKILKSFDLDFTGPKKRSFFIFHFDKFLTTFAKHLMKKPTNSITNIESTHNFLHFHKDLRSINF